MPQTVVVALQQFCEEDDRPQRRLEEAGLSVRRNTLGRRPLAADLPGLLHDAEAVIAGIEPYTAELLVRLPRLRCISRCGVGTEAIDLDAARRQGIAVLTTAGEVVQPVAELTLAMILALARQLPQSGADLRAGQWRKRTGVLLSEWTIGLIGYGRIGRAVAASLRPFGSRILAADPRLASAALPEGVQTVPLTQLLAEADVVSLHAARRPEEGPLLGRDELARMKPGSYVVNTARGHLLDQEALGEALAAGRLAGAALDVYAQEPYIGALTQAPNVICTPHIATLTRASRAAMELRAAEQVVRCLAQAAAGAVA